MQWLADNIEFSRDIIFPRKPTWKEEDYPDLTGKVYIVTGATSGIGYESARLLASRNATVYITGRTPSKIESSLASLKAAYPDTKVELLKLKNEDLASIKPGVEEFLAKESRLDGIIHNAGINYRGQNYTDVGLLDIITINVVAPHLLNKLLAPLLKDTAANSPLNSVRIVWVTSSIHHHSPPYGGIDWDDMNHYDSGSYLGTGNGMYGQTKAMNIYEAIQWSKHLEGSGVVSVAAHPGLIYSDIRRNNKWRKTVMELGCKPTVWGAYAELWPLLNPAITTADNGKYYVPFGVEVNPRRDVVEAANGPRGTKFWDWLNELVKPYQ